MLKCFTTVWWGVGNVVAEGGRGRQKKIRVPEPGTIYDTLVKIAELQPHPLHSNKLQHRPPPSSSHTTHHPVDRTPLLPSRTTTRNAIKLLHLNGFYFGPRRLPQPGTGPGFIGVPFLKGAAFAKLYCGHFCLCTPCLHTPPLIPPLFLQSLIHFHIRTWISYFCRWLFLNICLFGLRCVAGVGSDSVGTTWREGGGGSEQSLLLFLCGATRATHAWVI